MLRGAAIAQRETGAGITVHVGRHEDSALEIVDVLREAGADLGRCSLDHLDLRVERTETLLRIAESGCFLEFDLFGHESSYYPLTAPRHAERRPAARRRRRPRRAGLTGQLLVSQDICTRHRLVRYGGHGYRHIVEHVAMRMRERGWAESDIDAILVENPARLLTFGEPALALRLPPGGDRRQHGIDDALGEAGLERSAAEEEPVVDGPEEELVHELDVGVRAGGRRARSRARRGAGPRRRASSRHASGTPPRGGDRSRGRRRGPA